MKIGKIDENKCRYDFSFNKFKIHSLTKGITFYFYMTFNDTKVLAKCSINQNYNNEPELSCYFELHEEICKNIE